MLQLRHKPVASSKNGKAPQQSKFEGWLSAKNDEKAVAERYRKQQVCVCLRVGTYVC